MGLMDQTAANSDVWLIEVYDFNNSCESYYYYTVPSGQPKFNTFQGGVLAGYGNSAENIPISSCTDLPSNGGEFIQTIALEQGGPNWNSDNNVLGQSSWQSFYDCGPGASCWTPSGCGWATGASNNTFGTGEVGTLLVW